MAYFPSHKRRIYFGIMEGIYNRSLSWAYTTAWEAEEPMAHIPQFRRQKVSSPSYPVDRDSICFTYIMWKILREMVNLSQLPLPTGRMLVPVVVSRWNCCKGRIDEMTRYHYIRSR